MQLTIIVNAPDLSNTIHQTLRLECKTQLTRHVSVPCLCSCCIGYQLIAAWLVTSWLTAWPTSVSTSIRRSKRESHSVGRWPQERSLCGTIRIHRAANDDAKRLVLEGRSGVGHWSPRAPVPYAELVDNMGFRWTLSARHLDLLIVCTHND